MHRAGAGIGLLSRSAISRLRFGWSLFLLGCFTAGLVLYPRFGVPGNMIYQVNLLGGLSVSGTGFRVDHWRSERAKALMAYLLLHPDREIPREQLAGIIWYDHDELDGRKMWNADNARVYLTRELHDLCKSLRIPENG